HRQARHRVHRQHRRRDRDLPSGERRLEAVERRGSRRRSRAVGAGVPPASPFRPHSALAAPAEQIRSVAPGPPPHWRRGRARPRVIAGPLGGGVIWGLFWGAWAGLLFAPVEGFASHDPDARYEALFPYYVELCAPSQYRSAKLGSGGSPGHAVMYLKGACRDRDAPFPKLRRCGGNVTDPAGPEHGAGISVNRWFRNVNWVAFDGRGQVFEGEVRRGEAGTQAR